MLPPRGSPKVERYTQTKSKDMDKDMLYQWKGGKARIAILTKPRL